MPAPTSRSWRRGSLRLRRRRTCRGSRLLLRRQPPAGDPVLVLVGGLGRVLFGLTGLVPGLLLLVGEGEAVGEGEVGELEGLLDVAEGERQLALPLLLCAACHLALLVFD